MKIKFTIYTVLLSVLLLPGLFSCKKGSNEPTYKEPVYVKNDSINQNVFNINSNEATLKSDSAKLSQGIYEFQFSSTPLKFKAGDIIVGQDNKGYLRKVISATINGNTIILQTSQATLEDLYKNARISFQLNLGGKKVANLNSAVLRETKVNYIQKGMKLQGNGLSFDFSNTTIYQNGPLTFKISQGNVTFEPNFIFDIDIGFFKVKKIAFYADNADLNINCDVNLNAAQKIQLANYSVKLADIDAIYTTGLITVVVNTKLIAKLTADVNAELNVNTGFINNYKISLGAIYDNSIWTGKYGLTPTFTPKAVDISGSVQFGQSLTITPDVSVMLYGVAGPYCTPELYEQFNANVASPSLDWDALLKVGVNTTVGANVTIFGKTLAAYSKTYNAEKELWNAPDSIIKISGDNQSGTANHALAQPLKIKVIDNLNNALKNVVVYFNVAQGGGSVNPSSIKTDANGFAETIWTLGGGTVNEVQVKVKKSDGSGISVSFTSLFLPNLTTTALTNITQTTASSGGNVTSDGGATVTARGVCLSTSQNPTTANSKTAGGSGTGSFTSSLIGLTANTTYYVRAYATNSQGTAYGNEETFTTNSSDIIFNPNLNYGTITDTDGNVYKTIQIGTQTWMAENLKTTKYNDGTSIPNVPDDIAWTNLITPGYCWYNNDAAKKNIYGALYNWYTVNTGKLAPKGWHVPTYEEWMTLTYFLGGEYVAGEKLKETGTTHWVSPNAGATNSSGFTALPGSGRNDTGASYNIGHYGKWWVSKASSTYTASYMCVFYDYGNVGKSEIYMSSGYSVRCVMD